jgi:hypothetical protein
MDFGCNQAQILGAFGYPLCKGVSFVIAEVPDSDFGANTGVVALVESQ